MMVAQRFTAQARRRHGTVKRRGETELVKPGSLRVLCSLVLALWPFKDF